MALTNPVTPQDVVRLRQAIQQLSHLRLGPTGSPQFAGIEVGHLTDTTLTRASAGDVNIEGNIVYRAGGTDVPVTDGGTGVSSLTDHGILLGSGTSSITPLGVAGDGYLPIGKAGNDPVLATITGTAKRVIVTNGAGSITLSGPQDLDTVDSPTFAGLTLTEDGANITLKNDVNEHGDGEAETLIIFEDHADNALAQIQGSHAGTDNDNKGDLIFYTNDGTSLDEAMRIGDNGFLGIGIQSPLGPLHTLRAATSNRIIVDTYSDNVAHYSNVQFRRSNNDTPGTMTATIDTMIIGTVEFRGTDTGLGYDECARIEVIQDGNAGADDIPANMIFSTNSTTAKNENQLVLHNDGLVGIGLVAPTAQLHIDQSDAAGAIPVLKLDQADIDDSFIDFIGTSAGDGTRSISSDVGELGACFGKIRVEINGVTKWIRVYDDST